MSAAGWLHDARQRALRDPGVSAELYNDVVTPLIETIEDLLESCGERTAHRFVQELWTREDRQIVHEIIERRLR